MAREKKLAHNAQMTEGERNIIQQLLLEYDIQSAKTFRMLLKSYLLEPLIDTMQQHTM